MGKNQLISDYSRNNRNNSSKYKIWIKILILENICKNIENHNNENSLINFHVINQIKSHHIIKSHICKPYFIYSQLKSKAIQKIFKQNRLWMRKSADSSIYQGTARHDAAH